VAISSLDALASQYLYSELLICPMLDARKKEVYTALYRNKEELVQRLSDYSVIAPKDLLKDITEPVLFLGDGVASYRKQIERTLGTLALFADPAHLLPRGSLIATLGSNRLLRGDHDDCLALSPLYIRKSDAEIHWEKANRQ
jgi:tRNA threonylcarbamoyladenosine biosynthesis protein TsaB